MMRALLGGLAVAAFLGVAAASATATERTRTLHSFYCPGSNTILRVIFDSSDDTATVNRIRKPIIRLQRADAEGDEFRYMRRGNYELSGDLQRVRWRVGRAVWDCAAVSG